MKPLIASWQDLLRFEHDFFVEQLRHIVHLFFKRRLPFSRNQAGKTRPPLHLNALQT